MLTTGFCRTALELFTISHEMSIDLGEHSLHDGPQRGHLWRQLRHPVFRRTSPEVDPPTTQSPPRGTPLLIAASFNHDDAVEHVGTGRISSPRPRGPIRPATLLLTEALAGHQGTVTEFLEDLVKERVYADKLEQVETTASRSNRLSVEFGHPLTRRIVLLRGQQSSTAYLYAETLLVSSRLPWTTRNRLETSTDPIGRVLAEQGFALTRVPLSSESENPTVIDYFILAREYRVDSGQLPVMEISEWFLPALEDVIVSQE